MRISIVVLAAFVCLGFAPKASADSWFNWPAMGFCYDYWVTTDVPLGAKTGKKGYVRRVQGVHCDYVFGFPLN